MDDKNLTTAVISLRQVLTIIGVIGLSIVLFLVFHTIIHAFLLYFASIIMAVVLSILTKQIQRIFHTPYIMSLIITICVLCAMVFFLGWWIGPRIAEQSSLLADKIKGGVGIIESYSESHQWLKPVVNYLKNPGKFLPQILGGISGIVANTAGFISETLFVLLMGLFLAVGPKIYIDNGIRLFLPQKRELIHDTLFALHRALQRWLFGRLLSMLMIGFVTTIGLWLADVPLALVLGVIAGLLDFIPFIGPFISAIPAILVALANDPIAAVWVIVIYMGAHILEDIVTPLIQYTVVSLPPAFLVSMQILFTMIAGVAGILLAEPLSVCIVVVVQVIYFKSYLKEDVMVLGEKKN